MTQDSLNTRDIIDKIDVVIEDAKCIIANEELGRYVLMSLNIGSLKSYVITPTEFTTHLSKARRFKTSRAALDYIQNNMTIHFSACVYKTP